MANGHVVIYDPISNHDDLTDVKPTSGADDMGDTEEFRVMMAYAKRRRPQKEASTPKASEVSPAKGPSSPQTPAKNEKDVEEKKKKKKGLKRLASIFICIKPQTEREEPIITNTPDVGNRCFVPEDGEQTEEKEKDKLDEVAGRLTEIADKIPLIRPEIETDSPGDEDENVERVIGLLLREAGDQLNEQEQIDSSVITGIFWDYGFFDKLVTSLLTKMGLITDPETLGPKASPKAHIAVTCEVTSRLSAVDTLPMSRMLNYGARYLQQHYSSWAQEQGGYEAAFHSEDEDEDEVH